MSPPSGGNIAEATVGEGAGHGRVIVGALRRLGGHLPRRDGEDRSSNQVGRSRIWMSCRLSRKVSKASSFDWSDVTHGFPFGPRHCCR